MKPAEGGGRSEAGRAGQRLAQARVFLQVKVAHRDISFLVRLVRTRRTIESHHLQGGREEAGGWGLPKREWYNLETKSYLVSMS